MCVHKSLRWRPVTKVVNDIGNNLVELSVGGVHGGIMCCTTVTESHTRLITVWIAECLEKSTQEIKAGVRVFMCVLKAEKLTYRRSNACDDNLKGLHWMVLAIARLQYLGWPPLVHRSHIVSELLRFAADADFDEVVADVGKGGIASKKSPAYSKFSNHAIVVMDPYTQERNLTSRCTPAKLQRIQGRLRQIVRSVDEDAQQF